MNKIILIFTLLFINCTAIVNHLSFFPYKDENTYKRTSHFGELFINTEDGKVLQAFLFKNDSSKTILLYFHGNAGNLSHRIPELVKYAEMGINVLAVSYRGFGKSTGHPSEKGIYKDGIAAYKYIKDILKFKENDIFICGRSIGTTAAINTAMGKNIKGLLLISPLTNGKDYAKYHGLGFISFIAGNSFNNISKIDKTKCKVLIIHGTIDEVIPYSMGKQLFDKITGEKSFVTIAHGTHNELEMQDSLKFWSSIQQFLIK
jgi:fermentation-respiration switch protein FrsA (DUF1100 family)